MMPEVDSASEGRLVATAKNAKKSNGSDGAWNLSDPYMEVIAVDNKRNRNRKVTRTIIIQGNLNPVWKWSLDEAHRQISWFMSMIMILLVAQMMNYLVILNFFKVGFNGGCTVFCYGDGLA